MALKIIKPGSPKAASVRQFLFPDNTGDMPFQCDDPVSAPAQVEEAAPVEPPVPEIDVSLIEKEAYQRGLLEGEKAGIHKAEQKLEPVLQRYADSLLEFGKLRSSLYVQVEREVVRLAIEVAKKIVHREIQVDRDIVRTLVHVALGHVSGKSAVTIHLNPDDYGYLLERRAELSEVEGRDVALLADNSIERGGCVIQTECGDIDARIEEKFREVERAFFEGGE
ncbi:MAG: hypothetical protein GXX84_07280 [Acidobacteria bacterium]|nr:hypothetical protein [Acidobacteriota bacterium]